MGINGKIYRMKVIDDIMKTGKGQKLMKDLVDWNSLQVTDSLVMALNNRTIIPGPIIEESIIKKYLQMKPEDNHGIK